MLAMEHEPNELVCDFLKLAPYMGARRSNVLAMHSGRMCKEEATAAMRRTGEV